MSKTLRRKLARSRFDGCPFDHLDLLQVWIFGFRIFPSGPGEEDEDSGFSVFASGWQ
jgi:hypothetical protein